MAEPWQRDQELSHLHPTFREKARALLEALAGEQIRFRLFEAFRSPQRQQYLYEQGRVRAGSIVTKARPWTSYHQYGLAADFVLYLDRKWSWDASGERDRWWRRLHEVGRSQGLEPLSWEAPHLQLAGLDVADLQAGRYPPAGDQPWAACLEAAIYSWSGTPAAPRVPALIPERPALTEEPSRVVDWGAIVPAGTADWHSRFGGREWRHDERGLYLRDVAGGQEPLRTPGEPATCRAISALYLEAIMAASRKHGVPPALIMMVIATESAFARKFGFTGPHTFRWEPQVKVTDVSPPVWGDYSAGPMQSLATTARWVIREQRLDYDPFSVAPVFERRPEPPESLPLYDPATNIDIGTAEIRQRWVQTEDDPILVAAAYNAGGLYKSAQNPWRLRTHGDHLERAASWYSDACAVLKEARG